jgi:DUF438 domain-containing protein
MTITEYLTAEHRGCDALFVEAEQAVSVREWERAREVSRRLFSSMALHFKVEEEVLFPAFEEATGLTSGPSTVMRIEHEQMRALLADMASALAESDGQGYLGAAETLLVMMQQHNMKEENILYPMTDEAISGAFWMNKLAELKRGR